MAVDELRDVSYMDYLRSARWQRVRRAAFARAGGKCQVCGAGGRLECHHNNYGRLGDERPEDVIVLCADCHVLFHKHRRLAGGHNGT